MTWLCLVLYPLWKPFWFFKFFENFLCLYVTEFFLLLFWKKSFISFVLLLFWKSLFVLWTNYLPVRNRNYTLFLQFKQFLTFSNNADSLFILSLCFSFLAEFNTFQSITFHQWLNELFLEIFSALSRIVSCIFVFMISDL